MSSSNPTIPQLPTAEQLAAFAKALDLASRNMQFIRGRRSTLSRANAEEFLPFMQQLVSDPAKGVVIVRKESFPTVGLHTLYLKWQGALQYLIEYTSVERSLKDMAALIKTSFIARENYQADSLVVTLRTGRERTTKKSLKLGAKLVEVRTHDAPRTQWKEEFLEWAASGESGVPFIRSGLVLNDEDIEFVRSLCDGAGWDHDVSMMEIRAMKE